MNKLPLVLLAISAALVLMTCDGSSGLARDVYCYESLRIQDNGVLPLALKIGASEVNDSAASSCIDTCRRMLDAVGRNDLEAFREIFGEARDLPEDVPQGMGLQIRYPDAEGALQFLRDGLGFAKYDPQTVEDIACFLINNVYYCVLIDRFTKNGETRYARILFPFQETNGKFRFAQEFQSSNVGLLLKESFSGSGTDAEFSNCGPKYRQEYTIDLGFRLGSKGEKPLQITFDGGKPNELEDEALAAYKYYQRVLSLTDAFPEEDFTSTSAWKEFLSNWPDNEQVFLQSFDRLEDLESHMRRSGFFGKIAFVMDASPLYVLVPEELFAQDTLGTAATTPQSILKTQDGFRITESNSPLRSLFERSDFVHQLKEIVNPTEE